MTLSLPPSLYVPILLIPAALRFTVNTFSLLLVGAVVLSGMTIRALYSVATPACVIRTLS